jgi:hypothetical protein
MRRSPIGIYSAATRRKQVCPPRRCNRLHSSPILRQGPPCRREERPCQARFRRLPRLRPKRTLGRSPSFDRSRANNTTSPKRSSDGRRRVETANKILPPATVGPKRTDGSNAAAGLGRHSRNRWRRRDRFRSRASRGSRLGAKGEPMPPGDGTGERHEGHAQQIAHALFS